MSGFADPQFPQVAFWEVFRHGFSEPIARFANEGHATIFVQAATTTPTLIGDTTLTIVPTYREFI